MTEAADFAEDVERLAKMAVDAAFHLHRDLGPGLLESVYETLLAMRLERLGLKVERQKPIDMLYEGVHFRGAFTADLIVDDRLLLELKSTERTAPVHVKQLLTYIKLMDLPLGLLINFGTASFREGIRRGQPSTPLAKSPLSCSLEPGWGGT